MANKRILGVLTVKDGRLVKSYGYSSWRPVGELSTALRNLDRWAADEIVVLDISRRGTLDPMILRQIAAAKIATPLAYGGGIRREDDVSRLMDSGCDRFIVENILFEDQATLEQIAGMAGRQAMIGSLPLSLHEGALFVYRSNVFGGKSLASLPLKDFESELKNSPVSEWMVSAVQAEGYAGSFPGELLAGLAWLPSHSVIWFGGLDRKLAEDCLRHPLTAAVGFGNALLETELALPQLREALRQESTDPKLRVARTIC